MGEVARYSEDDQRIRKGDRHQPTTDSLYIIVEPEAICTSGRRSLLPADFRLDLLDNVQVFLQHRQSPGGKALYVRILGVRALLFEA